MTRHKFTSYLTKYYSKNRKFGLDIGCREKPYDDLYQCPYVGIDILDSLSYSSRVKPDFFSSGEFLPFKNELFDFITCYSVIPYVKNVNRFFEEVYRVIKPSGIFVVIIMNLRGLELQPETNFINRFSTNELEKKLKEHNFFSIKHKNIKTLLYSTYYDKRSVYGYAIVQSKK